MIPISDVASQLLAEQERADGCVEWGGGGGKESKLEEDTALLHLLCVLTRYGYLITVQPQ